jgi:hypothetical protein
MFGSDEEKPESTSAVLDSNTVDFCTQELAKAKKMQDARTKDKIKRSELRNEVKESSLAGEEECYDYLIEMLFELHRTNTPIESVDTDELAAELLKIHNEAMKRSQR